MEQRVSQTQIHNSDKLQKRLIVMWNELEQHLIDNAIDQWRRRISEKGSHFKHKL